MFKNNGFKEKIKKYKKINIYPRNNHFRTNENLSSLNTNPNLKLKFNLNQLLLENSNINNNFAQKNKSFMNYINSKTSLNPYYNALSQNTLENNLYFLQRNKSSNNIFNKKNYFQNRHQKVIEELKLMQKSNNVININNIINNNIGNNKNNNMNKNITYNYQKIKNYKSKSINCTAISSKKNLYDRIMNRNYINNNDNKTYISENNELSKKLDTLNNTLLYEQKITKRKNKSKYNIEKKKITKIFNLEKIKKLKGISAGKINIKNHSKKENIIKSKLNKIKVFANKKSNSTPKKNIILRTCENRIKNKYKFFIDQNYFGDYLANNTEFFDKNNNTINKVDTSNTYTLYNYSCDYSKNNHKDKKIKNKVDLILNEKYIKTTNNPELNLNINSINLNEDENKIQNWIHKEKTKKEIKKGLNDEVFFEEKINKDFQNYKLSNKYFNTNTLFNDRRPFNSINLGKYFDLELSRFNNKLNNFNHVKKAKNIINSKHIFKPIY